MHYRSVQASDFEAVLPLLRQLWPTKVMDLERLKPLFERVTQARFYLCAEEDGRILAFGGVSFRDNLWQSGTIAYVEELVVDEARRGTGLGGEIMRRLEAIAREKGCARLELDSGFQRLEAYKFYERFGMAKRAFLFSKILA